MFTVCTEHMKIVYSQASQEMAASGGISAPHNSEPRIITLLRGKEESEDS